MQILSILLGFAATATAIDTVLFYNRGCSGNSVQCGGLNPDTCCRAGGNSYGSIQFRYIPLDWRIETRGHSGGDCTNLQQRGYPINVADICLNIGPFSGAGYGFLGKKRDEAADSECVNADTLTTEDGASFSLADLDEDTVAQLARHRSHRR